MKIIPLILFAAIILASCAAPGLDRDPTPVSPLPPTEAVDTQSPGQPAESPQPTSEIAPADPAAPTASVTPETEAAQPTPDRPPASAEREFRTDFSRHTVPYSEILSGGVPKDGIPSIDHPRFVSITEADGWLQPVEPVVFVEVGDAARAYPIQILMWHEIVNDELGGLPLLVTFCPLCNTAIAFERLFDDQSLDFGTTGRLRYSNLIMYDRQTESWWQQATGEAIAGEYAGQRLEFYPAAIISWDEFKSAHPQGDVLSRETGISRNYGHNPYAGYDSIHSSPFLYRGPEIPGILLPAARVLTLDLDGDAVAYPYDVLQEVSVINDEVGGQPVTVFWTEGTASALDAITVAGGRDVGAAVAYSRSLADRTLTFTARDGRIFDEQTGSEWNIFGQAVSGSLAGQALEPVVSINHFWFSWAAFRPDTRIYELSSN
jgi:hypothetical protein